VSGLIDTNLLLYGANADAPEHGIARDFLLAAGAGRDPWYLTDGILYEFLRVATHPRVLPQPLGWQEALAFVAPFLDAPHIQVLRAGERHWPLLADVLTGVGHPAGNLFFDLRTVVLMREHGIRRIYTADADFLQFDGITVVNPLRG
jgi:toxin-antitoxin system PIN domain toxin